MHPLLVTAALVYRPGQILITQRPLGKRGGGLWEFPGGKLEEGETPQEGLRREILEELGLEIQVDGGFDTVYHRYDWGPVLILAYWCRPLSGRIQNLEVADHRWVSLTELTNYEFLAADLPLVQRLSRGCQSCPTAFMAGE